MKEEAKIIFAVVQSVEPKKNKSFLIGKGVGDMKCKNPKSEYCKAEHQWIPCSERLPEKNGRYLATRGLKACNSIWNRVYIVNYSDLMGISKEKFFWQGNVGKSDFEEITDIIAWQPLPGPYKEG